MNVSIGTIARTACLALALTAHPGRPAGEPGDHRPDGGRLPGRLVEEQQLHPGSHQGRPDPEGLPVRRQVTIPRPAVHSPAARRFSPSLHPQGRGFFVFGDMKKPPPGQESAWGRGLVLCSQKETHSVLAFIIEVG